MNKDAFAKEFGSKLKKLRKSKGLSQEELAERIEKTVDTISSIERGLSFPRMETALELSVVLEITLHELFQVEELPIADREKAQVLEEINALLKSQPADLLRVALEQTRHLVSFKEKIIRAKS